MDMEYFQSFIRFSVLSYVETGSVVYFEKRQYDMQVADILRTFTHPQSISKKHVTRVHRHVHETLNLPKAYPYARCRLDSHALPPTTSHVLSFPPPRTAQINITCPPHRHAPPPTKSLSPSVMPCFLPTCSDPP
jgi:hypothetical protein